MTRVTIDAATFMKFVAVREDAELYDDKGSLVGYFRPGPPRDAQGDAILPFSEEEIAEMDKQTGGRPLKEILDDLSKL